LGSSKAKAQGRVLLRDKLRGKYGQAGDGFSFRNRQMQ